MSGSAPTPDEGASPARYVLHVADASVFDRFGRMMRQVGLALAEEELRIGLLTDDADAVRDLEGTPIECFRCECLAGWRAWRLARWLSQRLPTRPALVHVWGTRGLAPLSAWARPLGVPMLIHVLAEDDLPALQRRGPRRDEQVALLCGALGESLQARWAVRGAELALLPPAILSPQCRAGERPAERTLGVLWTGVIDGASGLDVLVDAVALLRKRAVDFQAALIGGGPRVTHLWQIMRAAGVRDLCSLVNEPRLWDQAMQGIDVCVVPARQSAPSLAPLLAMALRRVVIASRDQLAEWFVEDETAWQFTPGSAAELAYHLANVAADAEKAAALGQSAQQYTRVWHSLTALTGRLLRVYERVVASAAANSLEPAGGAQNGALP